MMQKRGQVEAAMVAQQRAGLPAEEIHAISGATREQLFHLQSMKYLQNKILEHDKDV